MRRCLSSTCGKVFEHITSRNFSCPHCGCWSVEIDEVKKEKHKICGKTPEECDLESWMCTSYKECKGEQEVKVVVEEKKPLFKTTLFESFDISLTETERLPF